MRNEDNQYSLFYKPSCTQYVEIEFVVNFPENYPFKAPVIYYNIYAENRQKYFSVGQPICSKKYGDEWVPSNFLKDYLNQIIQKFEAFFKFGKKVDVRDEFDAHFDCDHNYGALFRRLIEEDKKQVASQFQNKNQQIQTNVCKTEIKFFNEKIIIHEIFDIDDEQYPEQIQIVVIIGTDQYQKVCKTVSLLDEIKLTSLYDHYIKVLSVKSKDNLYCVNLQKTNSLELEISRNLLHQKDWFNKKYEIEQQQDYFKQTKDQIIKPSIKSIINHHLANDIDLEQNSTLDIDNQFKVILNPFIEVLDLAPNQKLQQIYSDIFQSYFNGFNDDEMIADNNFNANNEQINTLSTKFDIPKEILIKQDLQDIHIQRFIDQGSFANVYEVSQFGNIFAFKINKLNEESQEMRIVFNQLKREYYLIKSKNLGNYNVINFNKFITFSNYFGMLMELCEGTLQKYIQMLNILQECDLQEIIVQLLVGLCELKKMKVLHLDLKPQNILISKLGFIKIVDFNLSHRFESVFNQDDGNMIYMSLYQYEKEINQNQNYVVNETCDTYSMGLICLNLIGIRYQILQLFDIYNERFDLFRNLTKYQELFNFITQHMLCRDQNNLKSIEEILSLFMNRFVKQINLFTGKLFMKYQKETESAELLQMLYKNTPKQYNDYIKSILISGFQIENICLSMEHPATNNYYIDESIYTIAAQWRQKFLAYNETTQQHVTVWNKTNIQQKRCSLDNFQNIDNQHCYTSLNYTKYSFIELVIQQCSQNCKPKSESEFYLQKANFGFLLSGFYVDPTIKNDPFKIFSRDMFQRTSTQIPKDIILYVRNNYVQSDFGWFFSDITTLSFPAFSYYEVSFLKIILTLTDSFAHQK
ncbi:hypothetical protein ABPG72_000666 [Tetrahymena utriculariae]